LQEPADDPDQEHDREGEDHAQRADKKQKKNPVTPGVTARLAQVPVEEAEVTAVGFPDDVEQVAEEGNGADEDTNGDVDGHADKSDVGHAARPAGERDDQRHKAGEDIAGDRDKADDAIDAEAESRSRDPKALIEKEFQGAQSVIPEEPCAALPAAVLRSRDRVRGRFWGPGRGRELRHW
jgi:hypothetical protein